MVGPFRRLLILLVLGATLPRSVESLGQDPPARPVDDPAARPVAGEFALPGEEPPRAFVPAHPRTVEEQKRVESLRYYATARAQEELRQFAEAIKTLEKAGDPNSAAILRRLCRINYALGREDVAIGFGRKLLAVEPGDIETLALLINSYKDDPAAVEALLRQVASNPKLEKNSSGALYVEYELGNLFESSLQMDQAAASFAKVVDALDDRSITRFAPSELRRILGVDEAQAYLRFGRVFLQARKVDLAIKAFERGLVYEPDEPLLLLYLSQTYQEAGRGEDALRYIEKFLARRPDGRETYDLLAKILTDLKREAEIIPRFVKYSELMPKNNPLRQALADRYKQAGQVDKANAIYREILSEQKDTLDFAENFPKLLKERKTEEILVQLTKVVGRLKRLDPVQAQIKELVADPEYTDEVLDFGVKMLSNNLRPVEAEDLWDLLYKIAIEGDRTEKVIPLFRWAIKRQPNSRLFLGLAETYSKLNRYEDAEGALKDLIDGFPDEKIGRNLFFLADIQSRIGKLDQALVTVQEGLKLDPNDVYGIRVQVSLLGQAGKNDEAFEAIRAALKIAPANSKLNLSLGALLIGADRNNEAITLFKGLLDKYPNNEEMIKDARTMLSNIYTNLGDFPKAEAELEILLARDPDEPGVNNDLGYLYADQGKNLERAEAMIRKALSADDEANNYAYLDSLGWVLFKRGKLDDARSFLERASKNPQADSTIPDHLGDVYFQLQEHAKARAAWERALKIASQAKPVDKRLPEIRKKLESLQKFEPSPRPSKGDRP